MSPSEQTLRSALNHILILAPYRRDADYLGRLMTEHGVPVTIASQAEDLPGMLTSAPGVLVATHEALTPPAVAAVSDHLAKQPSWSELPIVILLDKASRPERVRSELREHWPRSRLIFYQRPVTAVELVSGIQSALLARLRQREVRDHIEQEAELRRELNHRVKNILASVMSIFEMTRRGATSIDAFVDDFRGRLRALANVHSEVFHADEGTVSIDGVARLTFEPYGLTGENRIVFGGPEVELRRDSATTLALCLHELATNAIKYGALSVPEGRVNFRWDVVGEDDPELAISWKEAGGPPVVEPSRTGYGTRYLRAALGNLFGEQPKIAFEREGLRCEIRGPLSRLSSSRPDMARPRDEL